MKSDYHVVLILLSLLVVCGIMFIILRKHEQYSTLPPTIQAVTSAAIRIQSVAPKPPTILKSDWTIVSASIAAVCGSDPATADRYEARNDALRSIARERNLASNDVAALVSWLASTNDVQRVERLAANLSLVRLTGDLQ